MTCDVLNSVIADECMKAYESNDTYSAKILNINKITRDERMSAGIKVHQKFVDSYTYYYYINLYGKDHIWKLIHYSLNCNYEPWINSKRVAFLCT